MGAYIIIGSSAAGLSAAQTIRRLQPDREIIVLSKDKAIYSRCMLHKLLSGERSICLLYTSTALDTKFQEVSDTLQ